MKLVSDDNGDFLIDPSLLTDRFCVNADEFRRHMRMGLVTSVVEVGTGNDEGRRRITVRYGNSAWRAVVDANQNVLSEETFDIRRLSKL
jgi:hypothetical protein